jgi:hypothetical protein
MEQALQELKQLSKDLQAEAQDRRKYERELKEKIRVTSDPQTLETLKARRRNSVSHRKGELRQTARAVFLARAFLQGWHLSTIEHGRYLPWFITQRVTRTVMQHPSTAIQMELFEHSIREGPLGLLRQRDIIYNLVQAWIRQPRNSIQRFPINTSNGDHNHNNRVPS